MTDVRVTRSAVDIAALLDPDIRAALAASPFPPIGPDTLAEARLGRYATVNAVDLSDNVARQTINVPGVSGAPDVALRIHRPANVEGPLGCIYWMHGGGLVMGNAQQDDLRFDRWCVRHQIMAVSVDYRLSPEHPYPGPLDDCFAGLSWVAEHAAELGIDPTKLGIGGASAGAGLAAGLALRCRDENGPKIASQLLIYPMLDDRMITDSSAWDVPIWPPRSNTFGWTAYLGDRRGTDSVPPYAAAARAESVAGLAPTLIVVGALDGFVDEDIDYAARLNRAGVETELHVYPGAPHGFDALLPGTGVARRCTIDMSNWLARKYLCV
jgi:acetyl esterase/lipase